MSENNHVHEPEPGACSSCGCPLADPEARDTSAEAHELRCPRCADHQRRVAAARGARPPYHVETRQHENTVAATARGTSAARVGLTGREALARLTAGVRCSGCHVSRRAGAPGWAVSITRIGGRSITGAVCPSCSGAAKRKQPGPRRPRPAGPTKTRHEWGQLHAREDARRAFTRR